ncbi:EamA family transporter [Pseudoneobacillus sp. C159]
MSLFNFFLILLNTLVLVSGQFLWKFGLMQKPDGFKGLSELWPIFFSPFIFSGIVIYGLATVLWLFILTRVPLSIAYPIQSLAYVFAVFGAYFIFQESLSVLKVTGVLFIMIGVSFVGISPKF